MRSNNRIYTVTKDISANYKKLRILEKKGIIKIIYIKIENNRTREDAKLPTAVLGTDGQAVLGSMKLGSNEQAKVLEKLKGIIDPIHLRDCMHLEAHLRDGYDYFATEDTDILDKRLMLESEFAGLKVRTPDELIAELDN